MGESGLLIRGASGSGKSGLTLALIAAAQAQGRFARLVADDRVGLTVENGHLVAKPHPLIAGQIEKRGTGILNMPHAPSVRLTHVIDLVPGAPCPVGQGGQTKLEGIDLAHFEIPTGMASEAAANDLLSKF